MYGQPLNVSLKIYWLGLILIIGSKGHIYMNTDDVTGALNDATNWFVANQDLLVQYAVNIVSAIVILIVGMMIAKMGRAWFTSRDDHERH